MSEAPPRPFDELIDALAVWQRRWLLRLLGERDGPASLSELAGELCTATGATDGRDGAPGQRETVVRLYHVHAPKLAAAGLVEFDHERKELEPTARVDLVARVLELTGEFRRGEA